MGETYVLARCINGSYSQQLVGGECYLICQAPRLATKATPIHQGNVKAIPLSDSELLSKNFISELGGELEMFLASETLVQRLESTMTPYVGPRYRFELVMGMGQFESALARAKSRMEFSGNVPDVAR